MTGSFHSEPNRAVPNSHIWFSVETPSGFQEIKLPASETDWSRAQSRQFAELKRLAEIHGTHIQRSNYRRG